MIYLKASLRKFETNLNVLAAIFESIQARQIFIKGVARILNEQSNAVEFFEKVPASNEFELGEITEQTKLATRILIYECVQRYLRESNDDLQLFLSEVIHDNEGAKFSMKIGVNENNPIATLTCCVKQVAGEISFEKLVFEYCNPNGNRESAFLIENFPLLSTQDELLTFLTEGKRERWYHVEFGCTLQVGDEIELYVNRKKYNLSKTLKKSPSFLLLIQKLGDILPQCEHGAIKGLIKILSFCNEPLLAQFANQCRVNAVEKLINAVNNAQGIYSRAILTRKIDEDISSKIGAVKELFKGMTGYELTEDISSDILAKKLCVLEENRLMCNMM